MSNNWILCLLLVAAAGDGEPLRHDLPRAVVARLATHERLVDPRAARRPHQGQHRPHRGHVRVAH